jgi:protein-L-isoaspartate(D-aspartate) O-methyltransferase
MTTVLTTTSRLAAELRAARALPAAWREAFWAVPRHRFLPGRFWVDDQWGRPEPISRDEEPERWWEWAYRNVPILTQFDDGRTVWPDTDGEVCTSSASKPEHVLRMLDTLEVRVGQRVLEIGTGTGYNAALLAARLGAGSVLTVEIDPGLACAAREALAGAGFEVTVVAGDGTGGYPAGAPYDRVIATAAVRVGELPGCWLAQARPGGVIVTPMRTDFGGSVALVRFTVGREGTMVGQPVGRVGFMAARGQRTPDWSISELDPDDPAAEASTTRLKPWRVAQSHDARWAIGTQVHHCVWEHQPPTEHRAEHLLWLLDPVTGSWAVARYHQGPGPRQVRQHGTRRLWDEVETAFRTWAAAGKPPLESTSITITPTTQTVRFDQPTDQAATA